MGDYTYVVVSVFNDAEGKTWRRVSGKGKLRLPTLSQLEDRSECREKLTLFGDAPDQVGQVIRGQGWIIAIEPTPNEKIAWERAQAVLEKFRENEFLDIPEDAFLQVRAMMSASSKSKELDDLKAAAKTATDEKAKAEQERDALAKELEALRKAHAAPAKEQAKK